MRCVVLSQCDSDSHDMLFSQTYNGKHWTPYFELIILYFLTFEFVVITLYFNYLHSVRLYYWYTTLNVKKYYTIRTNFYFSVFRTSVRITCHENHSESLFYGTIPPMWQWFSWHATCILTDVQRKTLNTIFWANYVIFLNFWS
jgi:hypothetical protein